jgi:putative membrane protein
MHHYHEHFWGMHFGWWIFLIIALVWVVYRYSKFQFYKSKKKTPISILKKRLAKGEITQQEYEETKKILDAP